MTNILALVGGGDRDQVIMETAFAAAVPCASHLDFLHIHVNPGEAALGGPIEFASGAALRNALQDLDNRGKTYSRLAADHIRDFCESSVIHIGNTTSARRNGVTASYREEIDKALERLRMCGRRSDLIVMGRAKQTQGLPSFTLEHLIKHCGRPMLVAASGAPRELTGTVMVCWNDSGSVSRAIEAAMPILARANRVVVATVLGRRKKATAPTVEIIRRLTQLEIRAEARHIPEDGRGVAVQLSSAADECEADLVVMGAYGRSIIRELLFGSRTEALLQHTDKPIFMMH